MDKSGVFRVLFGHNMKINFKHNKENHYIDYPVIPRVGEWVIINGSKLIVKEVTYQHVGDMFYSRENIDITITLGR